MSDRDAITKAVELLEEAVNPIAVWKKRAKDQGRRLSGEAYYLSQDVNFIRSLAKDALAAITAPQPSPAPVAVKKLEWGRYGEAMGFCSKYGIYEAGAGWNCVKYSFRGEQGKSRIAEGVTEKEALAIAQADFDSDVISVLQPSPARDYGKMMKPPADATHCGGYPVRPAREEAEALVNRLRGRYPIGPHLPNGDPEFGWRQFEATPINIEAAAFIAREILGEQS